MRLLQFLGRVVRPPRPSAQLPPNACILVIRPDHLGDLLLAAPAIGMLRRGLPSARLTYLVGPWAEEAVRRGPAVDELLTCPFPGFTRQAKRSPIQPYRLLLAQAAKLRGRFDAALVLRPDHWWGALLATAAGIPVRLGFDAPECRPFLTHALPSPFGVRGSTSNLQLASVALVQRLVAMVPGADPGVAPRAEAFLVHRQEREYAEGLLVERALDAGRPLVAIHPGAGAPVKLWPAERWAQVGTALVRDQRAQVVVTGAEGERWLAERVAAGVGPGAVSVAGRTSLGQLAALFQRAHLVLGPDSGPLHLAGSIGTPTVRLFGPTDPDLFMPSDVAGQVALTVPLACRPCGNLERPPCGALVEPACLTGITVERVVAAAAQALGAVGSTARGQNPPEGVAEPWSG